jgi:hypothetical protein
MTDERYLTIALQDKKYYIGILYHKDAQNILTCIAQEKVTLFNAVQVPEKTKMTFEMPVQDAYRLYLSCADESTNSNNVELKNPNLDTTKILCKENTLEGVIR